MADYQSLKSVNQIAKFTKEQIQIYRNYPMKKKEVITALAPIFAADKDAWKIVIDTGRFRNGFTHILGINRMKALKKLLYELDVNMYKLIDFGVE